MSVPLLILWFVDSPGDFFQCGQRVDIGDSELPIVKRRGEVVCGVCSGLFRDADLILIYNW